MPISYVGSQLIYFSGWENTFVTAKVTVIATDNYGCKVRVDEIVVGGKDSILKVGDEFMITWSQLNAAQNL